MAGICGADCVAPETSDVSHLDLYDDGFSLMPCRNNAQSLVTVSLQHEPDSVKGAGLLEGIRLPPA